MTLVDRNSAQGRQDSSRTRVLVVEDDPSTRAFIVNGLGSDGAYDFVEAASAEEAEAELAANRKIAILILDLGLPRISGLQL